MLKTKSKEEAKEELSKNSGSQFDPSISKIAIKVFNIKPQFQLKSYQVPCRHNPNWVEREKTDAAFNRNNNVF